MTNERLQELKCKVNGLAGKSDLTYQDEVLIDELIDSAMKPVSEDAGEAITVLKRINHTREQIARMVLMEWAQPQKAIQQAINLAIQALKQYQPTQYRSQYQISDLELKQYNDGGEGLIKHVKRRLAHEIADSLVDDGVITYSQTNSKWDKCTKITAETFVQKPKDGD